MKPPGSYQPPPLLEILRSLPRPAWILFAGTFVNKFGTFVMPFLALYLTRSGYSMGQAGFAMGAFGAGHFFAAAIGGYLADRIGRRKTITLSMGLAAVSFSALPFAGNLESFCLCAFFAGLTSEVYRPAASALLADLVPAENRLVAFSAYRLAFNAGWALGPATAGLLAHYSYLWLFAGEALTCALFGIVAWFALPRGVRSESRESGWGVALRHIAGDRAYLLIVTSYLAIGYVLFQVMTTLGVHLRGMEYTAADYGILLSINGGLIVFLELPMTSITRRVAPGVAVATGYVLIAGAMVFLALADGYAMLVGGMILLTFGEMCAFPVAMTFVANRAPSNMRGRYMGVVGFVWSTAFIAAPWSGLKLLQIEPALLWFGCAAAALGAACLVARIHRVPIAAVGQESQ